MYLVRGPDESTIKTPNEERSRFSGFSRWSNSTDVELEWPRFSELEVFSEKESSAEAVTTFLISKQLGRTRVRGGWTPTLSPEAVLC